MLKADLKTSQTDVLYFANKYSKWKNLAFGNSLLNFQLAEIYLNLESLCEDLKKKWARYQNFIHGNVVFRERASASLLHQVFPPLPVLPEILTSCYFATEKEIAEKRIAKVTFRKIQAILKGTESEYVNPKGKEVFRYQIDYGYKSNIIEAVKDKKATKIVISSS